MTTSTKLLLNCIDIQNERGKEYNSKQEKEKSFKQIADAFNSLTGNKLQASDICLMLVCLKAVRQYSDPTRLHDDSVLDLVSYSSLWGEELYNEILEKSKNKLRGLM